MELYCNLSSISPLLHVSKLYDALVYVKLIHITRFRNERGGAFPKPLTTKLMQRKCHASCHLTMSQSHLMVSQMPDINRRGSTSQKPPTSAGLWAQSAMHVATLQHASLLVFRMPHCRTLLYFELTLGSNCVTKYCTY